tara:strand:- start:111 stop:740 length:630 start_codon:yes stop_codon:yes gene_type:complete
MKKSNYIFIIFLLLIPIFYGIYLIINIYKEKPTIIYKDIDKEIKKPIVIDKPLNKTVTFNDNPRIIFYENDYTENRLHERTEAPGFVSDNRTYDDRVIRPVRQMPINIRTRGYPTEYQQIGILTNRNNLKDIKPLYGRQTYQGSNQWNYYTSTDTDLALKIPITIKGRKCTDEQGCQELYEKDHVEINGNKYDIEKYSNDEFRYIPYVF